MRLGSCDKYQCEPEHVLSGHVVKCSAFPTHLSSPTMNPPLIHLHYHVSLSDLLFGHMKSTSRFNKTSDVSNSDSSLLTPRL